MSAETSPAGEADSGSTANDKDSSVECPTCGRDDFKKPGDMKLHHYQSHGESIAMETVECAWCGDTKEETAGNVKRRENFFCNNDCKSKWQSENTTGKNHPSWSGGKVDVECDWCGDVRQMYPSQVENANHHFCPDTDCEQQWRSENFAGENSPRWRSELVPCAYCGTPEPVAPWEERKYTNHFCSQECTGEWLSENRSGPDHHGWKGGGDWDYGPNWEEQRAKARERDGYECQVCGKPESDHWRELLVHHITPRTDYIDERGVYDYKRGNRLSNLVTLCDPCHNKWEGLYLRPDTR